MFRLFRCLLDAVRAHCPTEILIVGNNGPSWAAALGPDAPVWRQLRLRATERPLRAGHLRRIVSIPLLEAHVPAVAPGTWTLLPPPEAMRVFADKGRFARYMPPSRDWRHSCRRPMHRQTLHASPPC